MRTGVTACLFLLGSLHAAGVAAQTSAAADADALFRSGKAQLERGDLSNACASFARSLQIDRATGALLALAICHEREAKLVAAVREYAEVAARSREEGRADRERAARDRLAALEPRVPRLVVRLSTQVQATAELEIRVNGERIEPAAAANGVPVDPGKQRVVVSGRGKKPWWTSVAVGTRGPECVTVEVASLQDEPPSPVAGRASLEPRARRTPPTRPEPEHVDFAALTPVQLAGVITLGTGLAAFGATTVLALRASSRNAASRSECDGDLCSPAGHRDRLDAVHATHAANVAALLGAGLTVVGVALYFSEHGTAAAHELAATTWAAPHGLGATVRGSF